MLITAIVPFYNEKESLLEAVDRTREAIVQAGCSADILLIDNHSTDGSELVAMQLATSSPDVRHVRFTRNFGPSTEASIEAGLEFADGDAAVIVYSDLQDPPEYILEMVSLIRDGAEVAYGVRKTRSGDSWFFRLASRSFYAVFSRISDSPTFGNAGDFMMISRRVIDEIVALPETGRFFRGLVPWLGFRAESFEYHRVARKKGKSKTYFSHAFNTALNGFLSFSNAPLRLLLRAGLTIAVLSFLALCTQVALWFIGAPVPGLTTIISLGFLNLGLTTFSISLLGEYIGRLFIEVKKRPVFVVEAVNG